MIEGLTFSQILEADPQAVDHAGTEALHHHVGRAHQGEKGLAAVLLLQVDGRPLQVPRPAVGIEGGR